MTTLDAEKAFDKVQQHFILKALKKVGKEGMHLDIIKVYVTDLRSPHPYYPQWRKVKRFSSKIRNKTRVPCPLLLLPSNKEL